MADPDMLVPWESVEQIVISSLILCPWFHALIGFLCFQRIWGSELGSCPICLHPPVAARMTRCGHKYCWPCILHFLALSDKPTRPCPICDAPVKLQDLKRLDTLASTLSFGHWFSALPFSVVTLEQRQLKVGDTVDMRLMKRERHSLQPQPVTHAAKSGSPVSSQLAQPAYLSQVGQDHVYSKLLLATPQDVGKFILHWERLELLEQWDKEKDCPEACFIQQALDLLSQRESQTLQVLVAAEAASVIAFFFFTVWRRRNSHFKTCLSARRILANFLLTIARITLDGSIRLSASLLHSRTIRRVFPIRPIQCIAGLVTRACPVKECLIIVLALVWKTWTNRRMELLARRRLLWVWHFCPESFRHIMEWSFNFFFYYCYYLKNVGSRRWSAQRCVLFLPKQWRSGYLPSPVEYSNARASLWCAGTLSRSHWGSHCRERDVVDDGGAEESDALPRPCFTIDSISDRGNLARGTRGRRCRFGRG